MTEANARVFLVDDDPSVLRALTRLLRVHGHDVSASPSPQAFLSEHDPAVPGCVVLDLAMPGLNGLELQSALAASGCDRPIIFVSGRGDVPSSVQAMKAGAIDFLTKPVNGKDLLASIQRAIEHDRATRQARIERDSVNQRLATLTPRERQVLQLVVAGLLNKQIAAELGTVEKTVKVHRARVMAKMATRTVADLVRVAERSIDATPPPAPR